MHGKSQNKLFGHFWLAFVCVFALVILFQPDQQASAQWGWPGAWPYAYGYGYGGYGYGYGWPNWGGW